MEELEKFLNSLQDLYEAGDHRLSTLKVTVEKTGVDVKKSVTYMEYEGYLRGLLKSLILLSDHIVSLEKKNSDIV